MNASILSERLELISLGPDFLRLSLARHDAQAEELLGLKIPTEWFDRSDFITMRLKQLEADANFQPWSVRAMVLRSANQMVGRIGFHSAPCPEYLKGLSPKGVELGYTVFPAFRRNGYAREATLALINWAHEQHGVCQFIVSISPGNLASLQMAEKLGFRRIGSHIDELDGPEDIFELNLDETIV
jgi:RimJ/RimL family protein N-acetyltransferase